MHGAHCMVLHALWGVLLCSRLSSCLCSDLPRFGASSQAVNTTNTGSDDLHLPAAVAGASLMFLSTIMRKHS